jgi:hypothetical protein
LNFFLKEMVEGIANGVEDYLIDGLSFKLPPGATYVTDRKSVTYYTSGSNEYSTQGTKLVKIVANSDGWCDPSTVRISFDVLNTASDAAALLRPLSGGWSFFRRLRILCSGTIIEDISEFSRCQELFTTLINKNSKVNIDAEGFGLTPFDYTTPETLANFPGIAGGQSQTITFTPLSGILSQPKYLPLRYAPLTFELELVSDNTLPFVLNNAGGGVFNLANTSNSWKIQNVQMKCDIVTLDNALDNSYAELLLSGKSLPISYNTYISQFQSILSGTVGQQKVRINVARSLSRLKSVFISFDKANTSASAVYKDFNSFYSPMMTTTDPLQPILGGGTAAGEVEWQIQLGNKLYPETPCRSHSESFYQLRKCLGVQSSALHSFNVSGQEYRRRKFIIGIDMEAVLQASFSGKNTRSGDLLNIKFDHLGTDTAKYAHSMYVILHSDNVLQIQDSGVVVYD